MPQNRPLLVAADETVRDEVLRLAAAVDCEIEHVPDVLAARDTWLGAPLVLIDESTFACDEPELAPHSNLLLVCVRTPDPTIWRRAFTAGVGKVLVLPAEEAELASILADVVEDPAGAEEGRVLAVVGARGGAGASVLSAGIAAHAAGRGRGSLLMDCDVLGGGLDVLLGAERADGLRWPGLRVRSGRVAMADLRSALPSVRGGRVSLLSCGRTGEAPGYDAAAAVVDAGRRSGNLVICDLDRALGKAARAVLARTDLVLLVVPAEVRACVAAARVAERLCEHIDSRVLRLIVREPGPDRPAAEDVAEALGYPLLAVQRSERGLGRTVERGSFSPRRRGALAETARVVLHELDAPRTNVVAR